MDSRPRRSLLSVAQKQPHKNLSSLIRALPELEPVVLVLAGRRAPTRRSCGRSPPSSASSERVRFLDWLTDADLAGLYRAARAFALPSFVEGFGLPVLEAMRHGAPVACSGRIGADRRWPEMLRCSSTRDDQTAVTAALRRVLFDEPLRRELAGRGLERSREFTWQPHGGADARLVPTAIAARRRP